MAENPALDAGSVDDVSKRTEPSGSAPGSVKHSQTSLNKISMTMEEPTPSVKSKKQWRKDKRVLCIAISFMVILFICFMFLLVILLAAGGAITIGPEPEPETEDSGTEHEQSGDDVDRSVSIDIFGTAQSGEEVYKYTLKNKDGLELQLMTLGATLLSLKTPDKDGNFEDVILGHDTLAKYDTDNRNLNPYFGATIGRVANRIKGGAYRRPGSQVHTQLIMNDGDNTLHGGLKGFDRYVWGGRQDGMKVIFNLTSSNGDQAFPGEVKAEVTYELTNDNEVVIDFRATTTEATPVNLCNHAYFNLRGVSAATEGSIYDHQGQIYAFFVLIVDDELIPTGQLANVQDAFGYDFFTSMTSFGQARYVRSGTAQGYDNNYCLLGAPGMKRAARVWHSGSGRYMEVFTDQPGLQFYTGNSLNTTGKGGIHYGQHSGFAMETQTWPDAVNRYPAFPDTMLYQGGEYKHRVIYKFSVKDTA